MVQVLPNREPLMPASQKSYCQTVLLMNQVDLTLNMTKPFRSACPLFMMATIERAESVLWCEIYVRIVMARKSKNRGFPLGLCLEVGC